MSDRQSVAGVLLAAGQSHRFGSENKLLADLDGKPLVRHAVETLADANLDAIAAVIGSSDDVADEVADVDADVALVENPDAEAGQATSVRRGIGWARREYDAVVFALGDMPRVSPDTVDHLVTAWRRGAGSALAAGYDGMRGNPVLFDSQHFNSLAGVGGDVGGRDVFRNAPDSAVVETGDPGVLVDVDTQSDLETVRNGADTS